MSGGVVNFGSFYLVLRPLGARFSVLIRFFGVVYNGAEAVRAVLTGRADVGRSISSHFITPAQISLQYYLK